MTNDAACASRVRELPPQSQIDRAIAEAVCSPCRSKRGVVIFRGETPVARGYNFKPRIDACDGSDACKATCRTSAIHAEQAAMLRAGLHAQGSELLHVKAVNGALVPSGGPSCVQCSKLIAVSGITRVWLYLEEGWRSYNAAEFHQLSLDAAARCAPVPSTEEAADLLVPPSEEVEALLPAVGTVVEANRELVALRQRISWLEGTAMPHARRQENANGFQKGWHAALARMSGGESFEVLSALVPEPSIDPADSGVPPSPPAQERWQPIETVPKDRWVWMASAKSKSRMVSAFKWDASHRGWFAGTGWWPSVDQFFTHWCEITNGTPPPLGETPDPQTTDERKS